MLRHRPLAFVAVLLLLFSACEGLQRKKEASKKPLADETEMEGSPLDLLNEPPLPPNAWPPPKTSSAPRATRRVAPAPSSRAQYVQEDYDPEKYGFPATRDDDRERSESNNNNNNNQAVSNNVEQLQFFPQRPTPVYWVPPPPLSPPPSPLPPQPPQPFSHPALSFYPFAPSSFPPPPPGVDRPMSPFTSPSPFPFASPSPPAAPFAPPSGLPPPRFPPFAFFARPPPPPPPVSVSNFEAPPQPWLFGEPGHILPMAVPAPHWSQQNIMMSHPSHPSPMVVSNLPMLAPRTPLSPLRPNVQVTVAAPQFPHQFVSVAHSFPTTPGDHCNQFAECHECVEVASCGWCPAYNRCSSNSFVGVLPCPEWFFGYCPSTTATTPTTTTTPPSSSAMASSDSGSSLSEDAPMSMSEVEAVAAAEAAAAAARATESLDSVIVDAQAPQAAPQAASQTEAAAAVAAPAGTVPADPQATLEASSSSHHENARLEAEKARAAAATARQAAADAAAHTAAARVHAAGAAAAVDQKRTAAAMAAAVASHSLTYPGAAAGKEDSATKPAPEVAEKAETALSPSEEIRQLSLRFDSLIRSLQEKKRNQKKKTA